METILRAGLGNAALATLLALVAAIAGCLLRHRPAVRHALWLLVLLKLITPPLGVVPLVPPELNGPEDPMKLDPAALRQLVLVRLEASSTEPAVADDQPEPPPHWTAHLPHLRLDRTGQFWLAGAWLTGSLLSLTVTGIRIRRWNRLLRFAEPASDDVQDGVDLLAEAMGIVSPPRAYWFPGASAPMLWAFGCRASLIIPCKLWDRLDDRQRTTLLVHELAHLRRKDHWVRIVELLATTIYWWLPLAWIARWALREAEEQCCDAWVVWTCPDAHRAYAETLLDTVDFLSETGRAVPLAASGFGHAHHLKRRVTMIMQGTTPRGLSWTSLLAMFGLAGLLLPLSPTWAQRPDDEDRADQERAAIEKIEESIASQLDEMKRKLSEEIRRIKTIERESREREQADTERKKGEHERERADTERKRGESERERADTERKRGESERERADTERKRGESERERAAAERQRGERERERADTKRKQGERERAAAEKQREKAHAIAERQRERAHAIAEQVRERVRQEQGSKFGELMRKKIEAERDTEATRDKDKEKEKDKARRDGEDQQKDEAKLNLKLKPNAPRVRVFSYQRKPDGTFRAHEDHAKGDQAEAMKELARAKMEVERARAQLRQAERQLEKLGAELKARRTEVERRGLFLKPKDESESEKERNEKGEKSEPRHREFKFEFQKELRDEEAKQGAPSHLELKFDVASELEVADRITKEMVPLSAPAIVEFKVLHDKYAEEMANLKKRVGKVETAPAVKVVEGKLAEVVDTLKRLESEEAKATTEPEQDETKR